MTAKQARNCDSCGQPLRSHRHGAFLPPLKAAILDAIETTRDFGVTSAELARLDEFRDRPLPAARNNIRVHIGQINELLAEYESDRRIVSIDRRYVLVRLAHGDRP